MGILNRSALGLLAVLPLAMASYACDDSEDSADGPTPAGDDTTAVADGGTVIGDDTVIILPDGGTITIPGDSGATDGATPSGNPFTAAAATKSYTNDARFGFGDGILWFGDKVVLSDTTTPAATTGTNILSLVPAAVEPNVLFAAVSKPVGLATDKNGLLVGTLVNTDLIVRFAADGTPTTLVDKVLGGALVDPNDLVVRKKDGTIYFTESGYEMGTAADNYRVSRLPGTAVTTDAVIVEAFPTAVAAALLTRPNGIALSPDENTLYVGFTDPATAPFIAKYTIAADGATGARAPFVTLAASSTPDGLATDTAGNVYVALAGRVEAYSSAGVKLGAATVPDGATSIAFGGTDKKTLFIVSNKADATGVVYQVGTKFTGVLK